ncbi:UDP-GlcNAc--UDP-phosphate GlcNAc-1-phosphate transferase [Pedobacter sp. MW01-1-1]|uniref:UDP-GlcNAc--UDP-phosphate GlcNAc-1-phosphate transferase n=1 Tax=Pedobacter sp. MW01-1-1 TaxID=3383027 RepID=UPI003FEE62B9
MSLIYATIILLTLFILEIAYFKLADHFNIIDKPNHRSSHTAVTIRGGGIIFGIATLIFFGISYYQYPYFVLGLFLIALISFLDDIHTLNNKVRLSVHLIAVLLMFYQWNLLQLPWFWVPIALIGVIGTINAYNFMDGINGITGSYSLLAVATLYYINEDVVEFTAPALLITVGMSLVVFNFFNFRKKAKCFAGDVGSVSIAFILVFLIGQLILKSQNFNYLLLLLVYGLDAVFTIIFRLIRGENIFEAHRSHFYQFLSNERKWPHLRVSSLYFVLQLVINLSILFFLKESLLFGISFLVISAFLFLCIRFNTEGRKRLLG